MDKKQKVVDDLLKKIDECDDLIVEISQIRYWLEDVVKQMKHKKAKGVNVNHSSRARKI